MIKSGELTEAQQKLDDIPVHDGEWHYLQSIVFYKKNWFLESKKQLEYALKADLGEEHTIVCGGTTATILERVLGKRVEIDLGHLKLGEKLPPAGRIPGIALVTEGILTLTRVCVALEQDEDLSRLPTPARRIIDMMMQHDRIEFVVGTKVNEAHQDPNLPQDLELRRGVIRRISDALVKKYRKEIEMHFF